MPVNLNEENKPDKVVLEINGVPNFNVLAGQSIPLPKSGFFERVFNIGNKELKGFSDGTTLNGNGFTIQMSGNVMTITSDGYSGNGEKIAKIIQEIADNLKKLPQKPTPTLTINKYPEAYKGEIDQLLADNAAGGNISLRKGEGLAAVGILMNQINSVVPKKETSPLAQKQSQLAVDDENTTDIPTPPPLPPNPSKVKFNKQNTTPVTTQSIPNALAPVIKAKPELKSVSAQGQQPKSEQTDLASVLNRALPLRRLRLHEDDEEENAEEENADDGWGPINPVKQSTSITKPVVPPPVPKSSAPQMPVTSEKLQPQHQVGGSVPPVNNVTSEITSPLYKAPQPPVPTTVVPPPVPRTPPPKVPAALITAEGSRVPTEPNKKVNPYKVTYGDKSAQQQADQMMADFEQILQQNPNAKIAITYSANIEQTKAIIDGYTTGKPANIAGANQAVVFGELEKQIQQKGWQDKVHILPVTTIIPGPEVEQERQAIHDMENIATHIGAGWLVLGLQNEQQEGKFDEYAIGGGIASTWPKSQAGKTVKLFMANMTTGDFSNTALDAAYKNGEANPNRLLKIVQVEEGLEDKVVPTTGADGQKPKQKNESGPVNKNENTIGRQLPQTPTPKLNVVSKPLTNAQQTITPTPNTVKKQQSPVPTTTAPQLPTQAPVSVKPVATTAPLSTQTPEVTFSFSQPIPKPILTTQQAQSKTGDKTPTEPTAANAKSPTTQGGSGFTDKIWEELKSSLDKREELGYSSNDVNQFTLGKEKALTAKRRGETVSVKLTSPISKDALYNLKAMAAEAVNVARENGVALPLPVKLSGNDEQQKEMFEAMSKVDGLHFDVPIPAEITAEVQAYNDRPGNHPVAEPEKPVAIQKDNVAEAPQSQAEQLKVVQEASGYPPKELSVNQNQGKQPLMPPLNSQPFAVSLRNSVAPAPAKLGPEDQAKLEELEKEIREYREKEGIDKLPQESEEREAVKTLARDIDKIKFKIAGNKPVSTEDIQQVSNKFAELKRGNALKPK